MLDVGTGTGLLALMASQLNPAATIHAVELHPGACNDARRNFADCSFPIPPVLIESDVRAYQWKVKPQSYQVIFANPPFYANQLAPTSQDKKMAKHDAMLSLEELAEVVHRLLHPEGAFHVLLPPESMQQLQQHMLTAGLYAQKRIEIHKYKDSKLFREIVRFGYWNATQPTHLVAIYDNGQSYSSEFKSYLSAFYLNL
jgi:tRNA1Val (adenine37-N6)-methyltransferase